MLRKKQRLLILLPVILALSLAISAQNVPRAHALTGLVCIVFPSTTTTCPTTSPTYGPFIVGKNVTVGVRVQGSDAMGGFDIYVRSDPTILRLRSAALGGLIVTPSLTSICINGSPQTGTCTALASPNGPGVAEVTTAEAAGANECGGIGPCSGLAFTLIYTVLSNSTSTTLTYPSGFGACSTSSIASPPSTCVLVDDAFGATLLETIQTPGATIAAVPPAVHTTTTGVSCTSPVVVGVATPCTATVTDTATTAPTNPTGTVTFKSSGSGTFSPNPCPTLTASGTNAATCVVNYTPLAVGTGTHSINATYGGDTGHTGSHASTLFALTVNKATPTLATGATSPITVGGSTTLSATLTGGYPTTGVTGSVTYSRFAGSGCTGTATVIATVTVGAANAVPGASDTPSAAGSFSYQAVYGGNGNNTVANGTCANVTVNKQTPSITTGATSPITVGGSTSLSATLTGGFPSTGVTGSVAYSRFTGTTCTGTATLIATVTVGAGNSVPGASDTPPSAGSFSYQAVYGGDGNNNAAGSVSTNCATVTVNKASPSITTGATSPITVGGSTSLSATLTGGFPSTGVTGSVAYSRFTGTTCTGTATLIATVTVGAGNSVPTAFDTPPSAGSFSYQAVYGGDGNNNGAGSVATNCATVTVNKQTPTITTGATSPITVGGSTSLSATLTGGFPSTGVTGSVAYGRFAGSGCTGTATLVATVTVGAANAVPGASDTPPSAGSFSYQAVYGGDTNNNAAGSVSTNCANVTVNKQTPSITTGATSPITVGSATSLSATLTGGFPSTGVTGSVSYSRFSGSGCAGTATLIATVTVGAGNSVPGASDTPPSAGSFSYQAVYGGDTNNNAAGSVSTNCANVTVNKQTPNITTGATSPITVGGSTSLSATLTGGFPSTGVTGSVSYSRFAGSTCTGTATLIATVTVGAGNSVPGASDTPPSAGSFSYQAVYGGDGNNNGAGSVATNCATVTVNKASPSITTGATSPITVGGSTSVSATLTGGFPATGVTGSVAYSRFTGTTCTGTATLIATVTVGAGNSVPGASDTPPSAGSFSYQAVYGGDGNNNAAGSVSTNCATVTVNKASPSITTGATSPITVGGSTSLSATLTGGFPSTGVTGSVSYSRFAGSTCTGTATLIATVTVGAGNSVPGASDTPPSAGSFSYQAVYGGDGNNNGAGSVATNCATVTVNKATPTITTGVNPISIVTGGSATVSATLTGGFPSTGVTGMVTYSSFAGTTCTGTGTVVMTVTVGAGNSVPTTTVSPAATTSYQAVYGGDGNNNAAGSVSTNCATLTVAAKPVPILASVIKDSTNTAVTSITVGAAVHDTATIAPPAGSTAPITGMVTYQLESFSAAPSATSPCTGGANVGAAQAVTIGTGNSVPDATAVTPSPAGFYGYAVTYGGDTNYAGATANCEPLTVTKATPTSLTTSVSSPITVGGSTTVSAILAGGFPSTGVTGMVTYFRFVGTTCTGTSTTIATVTVGAADAVPSTSDTPPSAGSFAYQATYNGDNNNNPLPGTCALLTVNKASPSITTGATSPITVGGSTSLSATLTGGFPSTGVTGSVSYSRFAGSTCTGTATLIATVTVGAGNSVPGASDTPPSAGSFSYQAVYGGDGNNNGAGSVATNCATTTVNKTNITSLMTSVSPPKITSSQPVTVSATLAGGFPSTGVTGTVTYTKFTAPLGSAPPGCAGTGTTLATVTVGAGNSVPSATDTPVTNSSYQASYSGDTNNNLFTGTCADLTISPVPADFSIAAAASSLSIPAGGSGSDVITVASISTFTGSVTLSSSSVPTGITVMFTPNPVIVPTAGSSSTSLAIFANVATPMSFIVTITGTSGTIAHSLNVTVTVTPSVAFTAGKLHWTHHLSLTKSGGMQSWTAIVANSLSTSANVVIRIVGQSTVLPGTNVFDVTCGMVCVNTNGNVNTAALGAIPVSVPVTSSFSFSFSQAISSGLSDQKITFQATVYWSTTSTYGATSTKAGSFAVVP